MSATLKSYDEIPYHSGPFSQTHPSRLAVSAVLFGLPTPPTVGTRILELGCASGGNLLPMAQNLGDSECLGVDLSARQIADGQKVIDEVGLPNVELRHASIMDIDASYGEFDFIICHGVFSWVPRAVQDKILAIGRANLKPHGLCYISYNTYPGWHSRGVVRDMMQYHVSPFDDAQTRIDQARLLLEFLNESKSPRSVAYRQLLADEAAILGRHNDSYLYHEHLEEVNDPIYFHQFADRAERSGLAYLADAEFGMMLADNFDPETAAILRDAPLLRQEQYMDFLRNRMFRGSILCRAEVEIDRQVPATRLAEFELTLAQRLPMDQATDEGELRIEQGDETITAGQPVTKAALRVLNNAWPGSRNFDELFTEAQRACEELASGHSGDADVQRNILATDLMTLFSRGFLDAALNPPPLIVTATDRPKATPLARWQAAQSDLVTNQRHESMRIADISRAVLRQLDGRRDHAALKAWLDGAIARGEFQVRRDDRLLTQIDDSTLQTLLDGTLDSLAANALLLG